jgi:hypothetical protein
MSKGFNGTRCLEALNPINPRVAQALGLVDSVYQEFLVK